jgi:hypothetical protein
MALDSTPEAKVICQFGDVITSGANSYQEDIAAALECAKAPKATEKSRKLFLEKLGIIFSSSNPSDADAFRYCTNYDLQKEHAPLIGSALASACDLYAAVSVRAPTSSKRIHLVVLMLQLEHRDRWRVCLETPHDPHALVRNIMAARQIRGHDSMIGVLNDWLPQLGTLRYGERHTEIDRHNRDRAIIAAIFGEAFWMFYGPENETRKFDPDIIMRERPDFIPGLLPGPGPVLPSLGLPTFD